MKKRSYLKICLAVFILMSCSEENPVGPTGSDFKYPLKIGNKWTYSATIINSNSTSDSLLKIIGDTITFNSEIEIVRIEKLNNTNTFVLRETFTGVEPIFGSETINESYYSNQEDGLYFYAYRGPSNVIPKQSSRLLLKYADTYFHNIMDITSILGKDLLTRPVFVLQQDSLYIEDPPLKSLQYPMAIGTEWVFREPNNPFKINKKVIDATKVSVPAGKFDCAKIQWLYDFENEIEFFDYIAEQGIVKREQLIKNIPVTTVDSPDDTLMYLDSKIEFVLMEVNIE